MMKYLVAGALLMGMTPAFAQDAPVSGQNNPQQDAVQQQLQSLIGGLMIGNINLQVQLKQAQDEIADLKQRIAAQATPTAPSPDKP